MMMMTAKVNLKKILIGLIAAIALIIALVSLVSGNDADTVATMSDNDSRVQFLKSLGWDVVTSPMETTQVKIPTEQNPVYSRYNELQKSQGYDLAQYAGKNVMRYVYEIKNYPGAEQPVYATILVYKNQIIGGDVTDTSAKGTVQGLKNPGETMPSAPSEPTAVPSESNNPIS